MMSVLTLYFRIGFLLLATAAAVATAQSVSNQHLLMNRAIPSAPFYAANNPHPLSYLFSRNPSQLSGNSKQKK